jgi:hypothetical protein
MPTQLEGSLEENVLTLLAYNEIHAFELALQIESGIFSTQIYRTIADVTLKHIGQFNTPPRAHLYDLLESKLRRGDEGILLRKTLDQMRSLEAELQPVYVLDQLSAFIETRRLSMALEAASDALAAGRLDEARELLSETQPYASTANGLWFDDAEAVLGFMDKRDEDRFLTGIDELDNRGICPVRKRFMLLLAPPKRGKSWFLIKIAKSAIQYRKSVLHITLENSKEETAQRYVQTMFSLTEKQVPPKAVVKFIRATDSRVIQDIRAELPKDAAGKIKGAESLESTGRIKLTKKLAAFKKRARLRIEEFPAGVLSVAMLNSLLDRLDKLDNFKPDLIIIDAPYLMQVDPKNKRIELGQLFINLKGLAAQRNVAIVGVHQVGRSGSTARVVHSTDIAEDYSAIMTVDCVITYSATPTERKSGLARLLVEACRYAADGFMIMITQNYPTGQFCLDSAYMSEYVEQAAERYVKDAKDAGEDVE